MKTMNAIAGIAWAGWLAAILCTPSCIAGGRGTVCLVPGAFDAFAKGGATVEAEQAHLQRPDADMASEAVRYVQVDRLAPVEVTSLKAGRIAGIPVGGRHAVRIAKRSDMTQAQAAFRFSFREHRSTGLCLWYETFYGSWRLQDGAACHCR